MTASQQEFSQRILSSIIWKEELWFIAQCVEIELASQGVTEEEAQDNLHEAILLDADLPSRLPDASTMEFELRANGGAEVPKTLCAKPSTFRKVRFALEAAGFDGVVQRGNHAKFVKNDGQLITTVILPHFVELAPGTVSSIIRQSGLPAESFLP
jgi:predicted RNA binding protein YcfA (HicA-like mRNA interferase family)